MHANASAEPASASHVGGPYGSTWHDDLLGGSWQAPGSELEDDEEATIREIESLIGDLVAELEA